MRMHIAPGRACGEVTAPPSKSMAHRLLLCAGLTEGESLLHGIAPSADMAATLGCLSAMGAAVHRSGDTVRIQGFDPKNAAGTTLFCGESGTTLRFFLPICLLSGGEFRLTGAKRLLARPLSVYESLCAERGLVFRADADGVTVQGTLSGGEYTVPGDISSQFISGLLFALPLCAQESRIRLTGTVESRSYITLTLRALAQFGISAAWLDDRTLSVPGGQIYRACEATAEGDESNAAFLDALNLFGGRVTILGRNPETAQGDRIYPQAFAALCREKATLSLADCPDLAPILFAVAAAHHGGIFTDTARLKWKESDRGEAMAAELAKLGIRTELSENRIVVHSGVLHAPTEPLCGHNDHRVVMALAILLTTVGGCIEGAEAVEKSFPDFWQRLAALGIPLRDVTLSPGGKF